MAKRVIVIGAGIIGAAIALGLSRAGMQVTVLEAATPATGATGRSFGWINASFHQDKAHFHLRNQAIAAWHRLEGVLPRAALRWCGCLCWEHEGPALTAQAAELEALGYAVERLDAAAFAKREPQVRAPAECLSFPTEAVAEPVAVTRAMLRLAGDHGAKLIEGVAATAICTGAGRVQGVQTAQGMMAADHVIVAAGVAAPALLVPVGVALPMLPRPGLMLRSQALPPLLRHVCVCPEMEFRQDAKGHLLAPTAASHQSDRTEVIQDRPEDLADAALVRLQRQLPGVALRWEAVMLAARPVPQDGLPVIGAAGPEGLYLAVMHSGVTLAALVGEAVCQEVAQGQVAAGLGAYRPQRFA
ncbi:FAD-binding oxidoreductase [Pseudorhodobacter sp. E13]|uniref:NAD(P)/FAD-dependent oxidoreductase n=1 Tax=Pseudorhodobacter sp. E13 TaxID=2487931 RepID=UPI0013153CD6|nr:FAD-dependent oxidoreductase [Pseudorhodobacter sp. E13]